MTDENTQDQAQDQAPQEGGLYAMADKTKEPDDTGKQFEDQTAEQSPEPTQAPDAPTSSRPDGLEDKFWDDDKGEVKFDLLHKNYRELSKKFSQGDHKAPETIDGYKTDVSDEVKAGIFADGDDSNDPIMKAAREAAKEAGLSNDMFNKFMTPVLGVIAEANDKAIFDANAEIEKLGPNGRETVAHMMKQGDDMLAHGIFSDEEHQAYDMAAGSAAGMRMLQKVAQNLDKGTTAIPTNPQVNAGMPSKAELSEMLNSERYGNDPEFAKKVDDLYEKMSPSSHR